ncbi:MAG: YaiI/YqxD family protein [Clostridiales bacterium]|nr:YaiI/YqxD family protein [Clostridiales bacterium]
MRILVDADGCPVVELTIQTAARFGVPVLLLCDTAHILEREGAETVTVSQGANSVDFALVNRVQAGELVVTQDYGLAAMCLARGARVLRQDGLEYTPDNIDALLLARHTAQKQRRAGGRLKGPARRTAEEDAAFERALIRLLEKGR